MFKAVREYFAKPEEDVPIRGRGRRLAQLFAFEFVVVLLGVLAAQVLQDWFSDRKDARRAQEAVAAMDEEAKRFRTLAEYRVRAHECEMARLGRLKELIRTGGAATAAERAPPLMPMPVVTEWSDDTRRIIAKYSKAGILQRYDGLRLLAQMISDRQRQLEDQWAEFGLLAPEVRNPEDREVLAVAAARSQGLLSAIDGNAASLPQLAPDAQLATKSLEALAKMPHPCAAAALKPLSPAPAQPQRR